MSDIRFNRWLHQSGTGGIYQHSDGNIGIGTSVPRSALDVLSGSITVGDNLLSSSGVSTFSDVSAAGINVTGVVTATSYQGDGSALTGIDATSLKDSDGNVVIQAEASGAVVTGILTVGNTTITKSSISIGSTTTDGRNAGVGTADGTLIFNSSTNLIEAFGPAGWVSIVNVLPFEASSPTVTADTSSRSGYAVFTFTGPGSLEVTGGPAKSAEYLVIGGGAAGGGAHAGGGGGAGGFISGSDLTLSPGTYEITVGGGGASAGDGTGNNGNSSHIANPGITSISAYGGGGGRSGSAAGVPGASGGGASGSPGTYSGGTGNRIAGTSTPIPTQGNPGGSVSNPNWGSGAGGGGSSGTGGGGGGQGQGPAGGPGGAGSPSSITGSSVYYSGGGGGGSWGGPGGPGGTGGGARGGGNNGAGGTATANTGGGGGGSNGNGSPRPGGAGGSGIVIIAYPTS